ncbi:MAG: hypothetical protein ABIT05_15080 [Chitinophagaceae bacterium]
MSKLITFLRTKPVFIFLLPVFFVLHGYSENYNLVPVKDAVILALFYIGLGLGISLLFWPLYKSHRKAHLFAICILGYQFFFGSAFDFLKKTFNDSFLSHYSFILPVSLLAFVLVLVMLRKTKRPLLKPVLFLNVLLGIFILTDCGLLAIKANKKTAIAPVNTVFSPCLDCPSPDIYLIIADGYPGKTELQDLFAYDNTAFENELQKRKFHIIDSSSSNYNFTPFSVSSMFNMHYLEGIVGSNSNKNDLSLCYNTLQNSALLQFLAGRGYEFFNFSIFDFARQPSLAVPTFLPRRTKSITTQTFTSRLKKDLGYHLVTTFKLPSLIKADRNRDLNNNTKLFSRTMEIAEQKSARPKFVYTHLAMPHYPYYFDSSGNAMSYTMLTDEYILDKKAFLGYLHYSNRKYLELIDHILAASATPPIIILMSDHGLRELKDSVDKKYYFMNLNSVFLPGSNYSGFYKGQTNINQFRIILNTQFQQHLRLLKDSSSFLVE